MGLVALSKTILKILHTNTVKNRNYLSAEMMLDRLDNGLKFYAITLFWFPEGQFSFLSDDPLDFEKQTLFPQQ